MGRQLLPGRGDVERISRDGRVMLLQRLRGYSIDTCCSLLTSIQLPGAALLPTCVWRLSWRCIDAVVSDIISICEI